MKIDFLKHTLSLLLFFVLPSTTLLYSGNSNDKDSSLPQRAVERIYITTDRDSYVSGETMWLSLFLTDANKNHALSTVSSMAYLELFNSDALVLTFKVALLNGRGSGSIELPPSLPTGNYIIKAYTRQMVGENTPRFFQKMISVYNTLTADRVEGNVRVEKEKEKEKGALSESSYIESLSNSSTDIETDIVFGSAGRVIPAGEALTFTLSNSGKKGITSSLSVFRKDSLSVKKYGTIIDFLQQRNSDSRGVIGSVVPEYEGEIIKGRVISDKPELLRDAIIFFSVAGEKSRTYSSAVDSNGIFAVYTTPFYGERDVVVEMPYADSTISISYELLDPFVKDAPEHIPSLCLDSTIALSLMERSVEMQIGRRFHVDTLFEYLHEERDPLLKSNPVVYRLDDYVRFPVMREVVTEYIPQLRFRKVDKIDYLQVRMTNQFRSLVYAKENSLVLLDGIPLFNHEKILNYDPLRVESISIYTDVYNIGFSIFTGAVLFKTYRGDYPGLTLGGNAKIFDFKGALHPSRFTATGVREVENLPDLRSLLYWDPILEVEAGGKVEFVINTSSQKGGFYIVLEGMSVEGTPFIAISEFTVE